MRVLLIQPDYRRHAENGDALAARLLPARSLLELGGRLEAAGHEVTVLDPLTGIGPEGELDLEAALDRLTAEREFDLAGIAVYTATRREAHRLAAAIKRRSRRTRVVVGGPHPGPLARDLLTAWREIDFVCLGAADDSLPELASSLTGGGPAFRIRNLGFRTSTGQVRVNGKPDYHADLTRLPPVRYHRYLERVPGGRLRRAYVMSARGCDHWCNFCSQLWKKVLLAAPAEIAAEIAHLARDCGAEEVILYDDCFGARPDHARAVLEAVIASGVEVRLQAVTRFDTIKDDWLELFRRAGGRDLLVGLESGAPRLRKRMNKHLAEGELCRGAELVRRHGLRLGVFLMFGFPHEDERDVEDTYRLLRKMEPAQVMSTVFDIKPGDLLYEFALMSRTITAEAWLDEDRRLINGMEPEAQTRAAARAMAFDRMFTREVLLPEHDPAAFILGLDPAGLEPMIEQEIKR
jgi:anaerobic magnesium-protoporphyrin IX monomethyl ester cyclase